MSIKTWQEMEAEIDKFLSERQRKSTTMFHRFYDTRSAGNYLPGQPADFLIINNGRTYFLEAKFSEVHESLKNCFSGAVQPTQTASARLAVRAGASYYFIFYSKMIDQFELWEGNYCFEKRSRGERLELPQRRIFKSLNDAILGGLFSGTGTHLHRPTPRTEAKS